MAKRKAAAVENQSGRSALDAIDLCSSQESDEDAEPLQRASDETDGTTTSLASAVKDDAKASSPKKRRHHNGAALEAPLAQAERTLRLDELEGVARKEAQTACAFLQQQERAEEGVDLVRVRRRNVAQVDAREGDVALDRQRRVVPIECEVAAQVEVGGAQRGGAGAGPCRLASVPPARRGGRAARHERSAIGAVDDVIDENT
mgnify:CR=1 FL=1